MEIKKCTVCGSKSFFNGLNASDNRNQTLDKFNYVKCGVCNSLLLDSKPLNKEFFAKYYGDKYYASKNGLKSKFEFTYSKVINHLKKTIIKSALSNIDDLTILDVGAGNLGFLNSIESEHIDKYGIDIYKTNEPDNSSIKLINDDFITHDFGSKKFDVVTSWHVIEHVAEPTKFIQKTYSLLKTNGIVIISSPNLDSLGFKWFGPYWYHLDAPRHVVLFKKSSLIQLAYKIGFKNVKDINMFYEFPLDLWHSTKKTSFLIKTLIVLFYPVLKFFDRETTTLILKND